MSGTLVIVNPRAGRGRAMEQIRVGIGMSGLDAQIEPTTHRGHALELARTARAEGVSVVVAGGGDGTVHEIVNGLLAEGLDGPIPHLGVLPLGSGSDYAKTFDIPEEIVNALEVIADSPGRPVDVASIECRSTSAIPSRYFVNIAEVGIGGSTVARAARLPRLLGPAMYGIAFLLTLPRFKQLHATIALDDTTYEGPLTDLVVAIGRVFGGGMRVAPGADPTDGLFDIQIHSGTKTDYVRGLPKVYRGTHLPHPRITEERARTITIECDPVGVIEADGEVLGHTPATFRVLPGALQLRA